MTYEEAVKRYREWVDLRKKGWTLLEIGNEYGITRQAVGQRLRKGEPVEPPPSSGISKYASHHQKGRGRARMLVRMRDNFTCQDCGAVRMPEEVEEHNSKMATLKGRKRLFDVHHTHGQCGKNSLGYDSTKDLTKMVTLCHKCHYNRPEHRVKQKDFRSKK